MKLTDIRIDGFGVWTGLHLDQLKPGLNVFYGSNESGKSTVLEFLRAVFFGFSKQRQPFLPPRYGGSPGGAVAALSPLGKFEISRHDNGSATGSIIISGRIPLEEIPGGEDPAQSLRAILGDIPESVFNHVFAFSLTELQEIGVLSDREVSRRLYDLSTGLDVSLSDVMAHLASRRERLIKAAGQSEISSLLAQRDELKTEIENLSSLNRRYARLLRDRDEAKAGVARLEQTIGQAQHEIALIEVGITAQGHWTHRAILQSRIEALGDVPEIPENLPQKVEIVGARIRARRRRMADLKHQAADVKQEIANLGINDSLWMQAPRVTAMVDNREWIEGLEKKTRLLTEDVAILEKKINAEYEETGLGQQRAADLERFRTTTLARLSGPASALRAAERKLERAQLAAQYAEEEAKQAAKRMEAGFASQSTNGIDLASRLKQTQERVALLRRRVEVDEQLERLEEHARDLSLEGQSLVDQQAISGRALTYVGTIFIAGVTMALSGLFMPQLTNTSWGFAFMVFGVAMVIGSMVFKSMLERSAELRLNECEDRLEHLRPQIEKARQERDEIDRQLPGGGGIPLVRLQTAERELEQLQALAPLETTRDSAESRALAADSELQEATANAERCRERWLRTLRDARLPEKLRPHDIRRLNDSCHRLQEWQLQLERRRDELRDTQRSRDNFVDRMKTLLTDLGIPYQEGQATQQLRTLAQELTHQEGLIRRREQLQLKIKQLRRRYELLRQQTRKLMRIRRSLLHSVRARDEGELRHRLEQRQQLRELTDAVAQVDHAIGQCLAGQFSEKVVRALLDGPHGQDLPGYLRATQQQLERAEHDLLEREETLSKLEQELTELAADRRLPEKQLQLAVVQQRLDDAIERWQVLAATSFMLDCIREVYEADRQPETLRDASVYFHKLSDGRYRRIWTPLGMNVLKVDDDEGRPLEIADLSRGTREQLFFSLRLALANSFAKRGVVLPLMLDDVLVNFDDDRVAAAAKLLQEYGERGRQVFVFTCHRHIAAAFQQQGIPVRRLPRFGEPGEGARRAAVETFETIDLKLEEPAVVVEPEPTPEPPPEPKVEKPQPVPEPEEPPRPKLRPRPRTPMVVIRVETEQAGEGKSAENGNSGSDGQAQATATQVRAAKSDKLQPHAWEAWNRQLAASSAAGGSASPVTPLGPRAS